MQLTSVVTVIFAIASVALAQGAPPACVLTCLQKTGTFGCAMTDNACLCKNQQFINAQKDCYTSTCTNPDDMKQAIAFAAQNCASVGVTLSNIPPSATGGSPSAAATSPAASASSTAAASKPNSASSLSVPVAQLAVVAAFGLAL